MRAWRINALIMSNWYALICQPKQRGSYREDWYQNTCICSIDVLAIWILNNKAMNVNTNMTKVESRTRTGLSHDLLTHLPLNKMAAISQTMFSDAFSWMNSFIFWLKFHWSLFLRFQLTISISNENAMAIIGITSKFSPKHDILCTGIQRMLKYKTVENAMNSEWYICTTLSKPCYGGSIIGLSIT